MNSHTCVYNYIYIYIYICICIYMYIYETIQKHILQYTFLHEPPDAGLGGSIYLRIA